MPINDNPPPPVLLYVVQVGDRFQTTRGSSRTVEVIAIREGSPRCTVQNQFTRRKSHIHLANLRDHWKKL